MIFSGGAAFAGPNLAPFTPSQWSSPVVVANTANSTTEGSDLLATDSLYGNWCVINNGNQDINSTFQIYFYLDGVFLQSWAISSLPKNSYEYVTAYPLGQLDVGTHTLAVVADATDVIAENNELDNDYTNTFTVNAVILPAPTPLTPTAGSAGQPAVPFFSWSSVSNASAYRVLVATDAGSLPTSPTATNGGAGIVLDAVAPTTNYSPTVTLAPNTTYYWEVHGVLSSDSGDWSATQSFSTQPTPTGLTIVPTFDSTITSDPEAATIEATIKAAISVYRSSFSDQVQANFTFAEMSGGLGYNTAEETFVNYSDYRAALASHATTADDATALAHLPASSGNPVNGNSQMALKFPLARAVGLLGEPQAGDSDATVYLNTSVMNLSSFATDPDMYSLFATVSHEMDEALGFGSVLNGLTNGAPKPTGPAQPEDLFRYSPSGSRSLTTALSATSYFSIDGTTDLAQFNQYYGGDFGDWYSHDVTVIPQVQDAFSPPGVNPVLGVELRGLDVIGFTRVMAVAAPAAALFSNANVSGGKFQFSVSGSVGDTYVIEASSNLVAWLPLSTNVIPPSGVLSFTNSINGAQARFFRAISP
jgi:hypothetical protein